MTSLIYIRVVARCRHAPLGGALLLFLLYSVRPGLPLRWSSCICGRAVVVVTTIFASSLGPRDFIVSGLFFRCVIVVVVVDTPSTLRRLVARTGHVLTDHRFNQRAFSGE